MKKLEPLIHQACVDANIYRLQFILNNTKDEIKKQQIKTMFTNHMKELTEFILNSNFIKTGKISENFIKTLHKKLLPPGYVETKKNDKGEEVIYLIPGEYKFFPNFPRVKPEDVKKEIEKRILDYNENINKTKNKFDFIAKKVLDFLKIHPFANFNGVVISIIFDLMLILNNLKPYGLKRKYLIPGFRKLLFNIIDQSIKQNNYTLFVNFLKENWSN